MPTGYTSQLYDGEQSFEDFVWSCARGMGALIMMRDDPSDAPIPKRFEVDDYHTEELHKAEARLAELQEMTDKEIEALLLVKRAEIAKDCAKASKKDTAMANRYADMVTQVEAWEPPSSDHVGFKDFMLEQLRSSLKFDCGSDYYQRLSDKINTMSVQEWKEQERKSRVNEVTYCKKNLAKEVERIAGRNKWLADLRVSVPPKG